MMLATVTTSMATRMEARLLMIAGQATEDHFAITFGVTGEHSIDRVIELAIRSRPKLGVKPASVAFDEGGQLHAHAASISEIDKRSIMVLTRSTVFCFVGSVSWV